MDTKRKKKTIPSKGGAKAELTYKKLAIIVGAALLLELIVANFSALGIIFSSADRKTIDMNDAFGKDAVVVSKEDPAVIKDVGVEMKNIRLTFDSNHVEFTNVTVAFTDDNFRLDGGYEYNKATNLMEIAADSVNTLSLSSFGRVGSIEITADDPVKLVGVDINAAPKFSFSTLRFAFFAAVISCFMFGLWKKPFDEKDGKTLKICAGVMCLIVVFVTAVIHTECGEPLLDDIPATSAKVDQYDQLFEAFLNGRLDLDIDYDTAALDALENPYDRSERNENGLHGAFWDRAYYDGKFYSYFGAAPIFTVYYPVRIVTSKSPTPLLASSLLCIYCVVFISLLYELFVRRFCKGVPLVLAIMGLPALLFGSVVFSIAAEAQFYFIAVLSGVASTAAFLYFLFSAYFNESFKKRLVLLALAGVSAALIAASRPTLLLYCFVGIIPAIDILTGKGETLKRKLSYVCAVGVPIVIGAALIMAYNYARFVDPFEFGFNYQLTVSRAQANTIKLSLLPGALYHYFFQQPAVNSSFPYIRIERSNFDSYTRYNYSGRTMGIFTYPAAWGVFLLPFTLDRVNKLKLRVMTSLTAAAILMSFIDMCKAGSHYRYTTDIAFVVLLVGIAALFDLLSKLRDNKSGAYVAFYAVTAALLAATIVIGGLFVFANEAATMIDKYPEATMLLRSL